MVAVGEKKYYFSAMFAALTAYTDANNADVPYESPSNKDLRITATVLKDGTTVALDQQQANDVLNANGVITAVNADGFKSWGNNTAAIPPPRIRKIAGGLCAVSLTGTEIISFGLISRKLTSRAISA